MNQGVACSNHAGCTIDINDLRQTVQSAAFILVGRVNVRIVVTIEACPINSLIFTTSTPDTLIKSRRRVFYMVDAIKIILRVVALMVGLIFIYAALFLYEDEQGKVQSTLEDWWLRIEEKQHSWLSRHTTFMREVASIVGRAFDLLFGRRIISIRSVCVSACYSIASFGIALIIFIYILGELRALWLLEEAFNLNFHFNLLNDPSVDIFAILCMITWIAGFFTLGTLPALTSAGRIKRPFLITLLLVVLGPMTFMLWARWLHVIDNYKSLQIMSLALIGGVISDTVFVAITRKILRWSAGLDSFIKIAGLIVLNCAIAILFIAGPISLLFINLDIDIIRVAKGPDLFLVNWSVPFHTQILLTFSLISMTNLMIAVSDSAFILLALIMLVHRVLWPVIARPVYALQRVGIARRSKLLGTAGIVLMGFGIGVVPDWLKQLADKFNS